MLKLTQYENVIHTTVQHHITINYLLQQTLKKDLHGYQSHNYYNVKTAEVFYIKCYCTIRAVTIAAILTSGNLNSFINLHLHVEQEATITIYTHTELGIKKRNQRKVNQK